MVDSIAGGIGSLLKFLLEVVLWDFVLFNLGRGALLAATLGRYPRGAYVQGHANRISWAGVGVLVFAWFLVAGYNRFAGG